MTQEMPDARSTMTRRIERKRCETQSRAWETRERKKGEASGPVRLQRKLEEEEEIPGLARAGN